MNEHDSFFTRSKEFRDALDVFIDKTRIPHLLEYIIRKLSDGIEKIRSLKRGKL